MPVSVVVGGQFGSEGKGKVALEIARRCSVPVTVVRVGGPNSGHTAYDRTGRKHVLRQLPAGCIDRDVDVVLPAGSYIDVDVLMSEIDQLNYPGDRIRVSGHARIITAEHKLRPSNIDASKHMWVILSLLVKRFRREWSGVRIVLRGDSAFCRHRMLDWCERNDMRYIVGWPEIRCSSVRFRSRARLPRRASRRPERRAGCLPSSRTPRALGGCTDGSSPGPKGRNPCFIVTNLEDEAKTLYERVHCQRGDMENRLREQQLDLFADRTSSSKWWTNQYRVLLAALAYTLLDSMRRTASGYKITQEHFFVAIGCRRRVWICHSRGWWRLR